MTQKEKFSKEELQKAKELAKDYAPAIENLDAKIALYDAILEMSAWKDKQFSDRVEMVLCIDCHEFESCDNCPKYRIKKELLKL